MAVRCPMCPGVMVEHCTCPSCTWLRCDNPRCAADVLDLATVASAGGAASAGYDDGTRSVTSGDVVAEVMAALGR